MDISAEAASDVAFYMFIFWMDSKKCYQTLVIKVHHKFKKNSSIKVLSYSKTEIKSLVWYMRVFSQSSIDF